MQVIAHHSFEELSGWADQWRKLACGVPFRQWEWMSNWWDLYGTDLSPNAPSRQLYIVSIHDDCGDMIAVAPWFIEYTASLGWVIRFLGTGEVCSEYLSILCHRDREREVAKLLADFVCHDRPSLGDWLHGEEVPRWDQFQLEGIDARDRTISLFAAEMKKHGKTVEYLAQHNCWRLQLPNHWDDLVKAVPKSQRKHLRRAHDRLEDTDNFRVVTVEGPQEFERGFEILTQLHEARWHDQGHEGCFSSETFHQFHQRVAASLLEHEKLRLFWVEYQGKPIACEYQLLGNGVVHLYQGGLDPEYLSLEPGRLAVVAGVCWAIDHGFTHMDFLRGDEPYKARWGAQPRAAVQLRIVGTHATAQLRHHAWVAQHRVRELVKSGLDYFKGTQ